MSERQLERPPRPAIPPVVWGLAATLVAERLVMDAGRSLTPEGLATAAWAMAGLGLLVGCVVVAGVRVARQGYGGDAVAGEEVGRPVPQQLAQTTLAIVLCACVGTAVAGMASVRQLAALEALAGTPVSTWRLRVVSDASVSAYGYRCTARADADGLPSALVVVSAAESFERGQLVRCVGRFAPLAWDDYGASSWRRGIVGSVRVVHVVERQQATGLTGALMRLRGRALATIEPARSDSRALLAGIACGNRTALDQCGLGDVFAACGLAHVVAVSGAHLSVVAALLGSLLARTGFRSAARFAAIALATGSFVLLCGAPPSAVRAWCMTLVAALSQLAGRRTHALSSVGAVALAMALVTPHLSGQLGFLLSVASIVALSVYGRYASYVLAVLAGRWSMPLWVPHRVRHWLYGMAEGGRSSLAATLVCQAATLPLTMGTFGSVSLVAPCANVVAAPLLGVLLAMGLAVVCLQVLPWLCTPVLWSFDALCAPLLGLLRLMARSPLATVSAHPPTSVLAAAVLVVGVLVYAWWPKPSRRVLARVAALAGAVVVACLLRWRFFAPARIVVLDVGQGDAILVQDGASAVLVDTGPGAAVADALARTHVPHLDAVVLTHLHDDHFGGMSALPSAVGCDRVLVAEGVAAHMDEDLRADCQGLTGAEPGELRYGDELAVGAWRLRMIWPQVPVDGTENADSIELSVAYAARDGTLTALLTGDAEEAETGACVAAGDVGAIDLLKVGHHGSAISLDTDIARALRPFVAVASAGEGNEYGHPRPECIALLEAVGTRCYCTKDVGDVELRPGHAGPRVRCQR